MTGINNFNQEEDDDEEEQKQEQQEDSNYSLFFIYFVPKLVSHKQQGSLHGSSSPLRRFQPATFEFSQQRLNSINLSYYPWGYVVMTAL